MKFDTTQDEKHIVYGSIDFCLIKVLKIKPLLNRSNKLKLVQTIQMKH